MRKKPYSTKEFFNLIVEKLKKNGEYPDILDYANADSDAHEMRTYEFSFRSALNEGGSEGIYLDVFIKERDGICRLGVFKTLLESKEAMEKMGRLLADFTYEASLFVNLCLEDFTWEGFNVLPYKSDMLREAFSTDCATKERALAKKDELLATGKYARVQILDYRTREVETFRREKETEEDTNEVD